MMEDLNTRSLMKEVEGSGIAQWSDARRKDFVEVFAKRVSAAHCLLLQTANHLQQEAFVKHYLGARTNSRLDSDRRAAMYGYRYLDNYPELDELAKQRAKKILSELPQVRDAMSVIDATVAAWLDQQEELKKQLQKLADKLDEAGGAFKMSDYPDTMTIGEFRSIVKKRQQLRTALIQKFNELSDDARQLDDKINKALFKGVPGLSEAVASIIEEHRDRAKGLLITERRVSEKIMFGDSKEAMSILQRFEQDETEVSDKTKQAIAAVLEKLNLPTRRQMAAKRRKKSKS